MNQPQDANARDLRLIRLCLGVFITGLALSGLTAFPLVTESGLLVQLTSYFGTGSALFHWVWLVHQALVETGIVYPFLAYGTDWLAFAHLLFALLFLGPYGDPVRNRWVIEFGLVACAAILPLALIAGQIRGIPLFWRLGDCSFGVIGAIPLALALRAVQRIEARTESMTHAAA
jgi:hypothetical protein